MYGFDNYIASRGYRFLWKSKGLFAEWQQRFWAFGIKAI